jgi:Fe-S-cluster-containing hydrogenase component 2
MSAIPTFGLTPRDDDEGLFSRDIDGQLVRLDKPTEHDYDTPVKVQINGREVPVSLTQPLKDAQGNLVLDVNGCTTPRYTTILDAVLTLNSRREAGQPEIRIPTLCHQQHMTPVAVCRACVVQVYGKRKGERTPERKLLPACQHQVKPDMEVFTMDVPGEDGARVRRAVTVLTELLMADHLKPAPEPETAKLIAPFNELQQMADRMGLDHSRFSQPLLQSSDPSLPPAKPPAGRRGLDTSSPVFVIDHSACILCDRCIRGCDEVKKNFVIGRTGKGRITGISFDLNDEMFHSSCVQCGECMVSCPTSAITFKHSTLLADLEGSPVPLEELRQDGFFVEIPPKFLLWQSGLVLRRNLKAGDVLCRDGDPGHSAYRIKSGELEIMPDRSPAIRVGVQDEIVGEMACLSGRPRNAGISAVGNAEVWEVRRNVLDRMMRSPGLHHIFDELYRHRALRDALQAADLFKKLPDEERKAIIEFLQAKPDRLEFVRVNPGQGIYRQGDLADNMFLIRLGNVRIGIDRDGKEETYMYVGPGKFIGEIGLLAISEEDALQPSAEDKIFQKLSALLATNNDDAVPAGPRTANVRALDHVELARINRPVFLEMVRRSPAVLRKLVQMAVARRRNRDNPHMREFVEQGLYQATNLLALDLTRCTRCDECTKACVQQHGTGSHGQPITRLLREGLHFGDYLVATSCRSCKDAYCMIGCPVDAIHRGKHLQIVIEDHCIGCELCSRNCPYGNIFMVEDVRPERQKFARAKKAATCDLCDAAGEEEHTTPRCVYACPHDAAHRMDGDELFALVNRSQST